MQQSDKEQKEDKKGGDNRTHRGGAGNRIKVERVREMEEKQTTTGSKHWQWVNTRKPNIRKGQKLFTEKHELTKNSKP